MSQSSIEKIKEAERIAAESCTALSAENAKKLSVAQYEAELACENAEARASAKLKEEKADIGENAVRQIEEESEKAGAEAARICAAAEKKMADAVGIIIAGITEK